MRSAFCPLFALIWRKINFIPCHQSLPFSGWKDFCLCSTLECTERLIIVVLSRLQDKIILCLFYKLFSYFIDWESYKWDTGCVSYLFVAVRNSPRLCGPIALYLRWGHTLWQRVCGGAQLLTHGNQDRESRDFFYFGVERDSRL